MSDHCLMYSAQYQKIKRRENFAGHLHKHNTGNSKNDNKLGTI